MYKNGSFAKREGRFLLSIERGRTDEQKETVGVVKKRNYEKGCRNRDGRDP